MKSKEKSKEEIVLIRYYNVLFYLVFKGGIDDFNRQCLVNRINTGESIRMKQIQKWCHYHQITYRTRFIYRKDFPLKANLWNLYSYIRFLLENFRLSRQTLDLQAYSQVSPLNLLPIYYDCGQSFDMPRNLASTEPQKQVQPPDCTAHQSWTNKLEKIE